MKSVKELKEELEALSAEYERVVESTNALRAQAGANAERARLAFNEAMVPLQITVTVATAKEIASGFKKEIRIENDLRVEFRQQLIAMGVLNG